MSNMKVYLLLALFLAVFWTGFIYLVLTLMPQKTQVDCSMAEFHPDMPTAVRKACRERRSHKL